jgi:hypothetical protein
MMFDIRIDDPDEVLAIRTEVIRQLKLGGTMLTGWSSEGTSVTKVQNVSLAKLMEETKWFLQLHDPGLYGSPVKRAYPFYTHYP